MMYIVNGGSLHIWRQLTNESPWILYSPDQVGGLQHLPQNLYNQHPEIHHFLRLSSGEEDVEGDVERGVRELQERLKVVAVAVVRQEASRRCRSWRNGGGRHRGARPQRVQIQLTSGARHQEVHWGVQVQHRGAVHRRFHHGVQIQHRMARDLCM